MIHPGRRGRTFAVPAAFSRAAESACKKVVNLRQFVLESNSYRGPLRRRGTPIDRKRRGTPMAHNDSFDEPRFEALYRKLYPDLLRCAEIALRTGGSWYVSVAGRAEEVVQELFAFAWEHQADLWSSASPTGWLYRVLRYKVLELLKEDRFWRKHLIRAAGEMPLLRRMISSSGRRSPASSRRRSTRSCGSSIWRSTPTRSWRGRWG